jgi:hypothetical protein
MSFQIYLRHKENLSQYFIAAGIYKPLMTLAELLQNLLSCQKLNKRSRKKNQILLESPILACRRLWRNFPYLTEANKCGELQFCGLKAHGKTPTLIPYRFSGLEIGVRRVFELFSFGAGQ